MSCCVILEQNIGKSCTKLGQFGRVCITCPFDELYWIAGGCAKTSSWLWLVIKRVLRITHLMTSHSELCLSGHRCLNAYKDSLDTVAIPVTKWAFLFLNTFWL